MDRAPQDLVIDEAWAIAVYAPRDVLTKDAVATIDSLARHQDLNTSGPIAVQENGKANPSVLYRCADSTIGSGWHHPTGKARHILYLEARIPGSLHGHYKLVNDLVNRPDILVVSFATLGDLTCAPLLVRLYLLTLPLGFIVDRSRQLGP